uniref:tRNA/rRNA methyltransferase SpoU type domain-containing protein n=1 Tax=Triticum aestivum TaxID=4565 RepID=A0A3B6IN57_WHEAT
MLLARAPPPSPSAFNSPALSARAFRRRRLAAPGAAATAASKPPSLRVGQRRKQVASVANPMVKHCVKLRDSAAYRRSCRRLVLVGLAPVLEICRLGLADIDCLLLLDGAEVPGELHELSGGNVVYVSATVMKRISGMRSVDSTEAIAVMHMPKHFCDLGDEEGGAGLDAAFQSPKRILVLDGIQALRAARGASLQLPIVSGNWCDLHALVTRYGMKMLAGHPESSSDGSERTHVLSKELADSLMSESLCLVLGSEGNGLSEETVQACDLVSIPMEARLNRHGVVFK